MVIERSDVANSILKLLSDADFAMLEPHLEHVQLPVGKTIEARNRRIDAVYFIESGLASVVVAQARDPGIEVALIGREGMTGIAVVLGAQSSMHQIVMSVPGEAFCISSDSLRRSIRSSSLLHGALLLAVHAFQQQLGEVALSHGRNTIEERLSQWLLRAHERIDNHEVPLTHETLASLLGVRRSGITLAVQALERAKLIRAHRSRIAITDPAGLRRRCNGTHSPAI